MSKSIKNINGPLKVGDKAPDFCLVSHLGDKIHLSDYKGKKNVLIVFFPLCWTPI
ncbi:MAG: redoxin domain-containing protein [candidate division Zixibacteria bacterium]|nr:redoxin domain-containing protein [candidate division Zixibacteria bacterium]